MTDCIFCKIISGEIPCYKVYEDDQYLAFLDIHPLSMGHTQIIPKVHHRYVWDVSPIGQYAEVAQKIAKALQKVSGTDEVHMKVVGEEVFHAHIWVYPSPDKAVGIKNNFDQNVLVLKQALT